MIDLHQYEHDTATWLQTQVGNIGRGSYFTSLYNYLAVQVELSDILNFTPSDLSNSREYNILKNKLSNMEMEGITKLTGCMKPCHYRLLPFSTPCTIHIGQCKTFWRATWVGLKFKHATWLPSVNLYFISLGCGPDSHLFENPVFDIVF